VSTRDIITVPFIERLIGRRIKREEQFKQREEEEEEKKQGKEEQQQLGTEWEIESGISGDFEA